MKKKSLLLFIAALIFAPIFCHAQQAPNISQSATYNLSTLKGMQKILFDDDYNTIWYSDERSAIAVTLPDDAPCYGLYIHFSSIPKDFAIQVKENDDWVTLVTLDRIYYNQYIPLEGLTSFRIYGKRGLKICELMLLGQGDIPPDVQQWQPPVEKADLMLLSAHPDDEILWFGGLLPRYAGEEKKAVQVVYMTSREPQRRNELLDGLWTCGVKNYPVMGIYDDFFTLNTQEVFKAWGYQNNVEAYVASLLRIYRPEVVVTHDIKGEYGHGMHKATSRATINALTIAQNEKAAHKLLNDLPTWQVKKLYLHLYGENPLVLSWDEPLDAFDGQTGLEVAKLAFTKHRTQSYRGKYSVNASGENDCRIMGLYYSAVGEDVKRDDLFENIP